MGKGQKINVGIDMDMFNNRLSITADAFMKDDMILLQIPEDLTW